MRNVSSKIFAAIFAAILVSFFFSSAAMAQTFLMKKMDGSLVSKKKPEDCPIGMVFTGIKLSKGTTLNPLLEYYLKRLLERTRMMTAGEIKELQDIEIIITPKIVFSITLMNGVVEMKQ